MVSEALTLTETQSPGATTTSRSRKGKERTEEGVDSMEMCGICLYEDDGRAIRGRIDSCDHFFCFVCIMEWAKVESRCPLCKARFSTIHRPPKVGIFAHERVVNVPVRDQVYHPLGNGTVGPYDPYSQTCCTECQGSNDENLLLLCDLCDSAAHTYCVGLGNTVPEGDWYCHDCSVSRNEHSNNQIDGDSSNQDYSIGFNIVRGGATSLSILDIVQDETALYEVPQHRSPSSQMHGNQIGSDRPSSTSLATESQDPQPPCCTTPVDQGARTLRRCRHLHGRIRVLRENWNLLRSGSMSFSSSPIDSRRASNSTLHIDRSITSDDSSQLQSLSSAKSEGVCRDTSNNSGSYDVARAWKMMDIAKSVEQARGASRFDAMIPNHPVIKRNIRVEASCASASSLKSDKKPVSDKTLDIITTENNWRNCSLEPSHENHKRQKYDKQKTGRAMRKDTEQIDKGPPESHLVGRHKLDYAKQFRISCHGEGCQGNRKFNLVNMQEMAPCSSSVGDSFVGPADLSVSRPKPVSSSGCKIEAEKGKSGGDKDAEGMLRKDDGAKSEVQSLVKLNLKMLSCGRLLGADKFKEIAKLSTHTILAACGLEHSKSSVRSFPMLTCRHIEQLQQCHVSNLLTTSCRECFYIFVKDVVNSIMSEKTNGYCK